MNTIIVFALAYFASFLLFCLRNGKTFNYKAFLLYGMEWRGCTAGFTAFFYWWVQ